MAIAIRVPPHVTRPFGAREPVAVHPQLDMSAWIMGTGKEVLCFRGRVVDTGGERARDALRNYRAGSLTRTVGLIQCLYKIDLTPKR